MINLKWKRRWCGYCGKYIEGDMEDFMNHLSYCELLKVNEMKHKRGDDDKTQTSS